MMMMMMMTLLSKQWQKFYVDSAGPDSTLCKVMAMFFDCS